MENEGIIGPPKHQILNKNTIPISIRESKAFEQGDLFAVQ